MTNELPYISIGIPFYNAESSLLDAVRSVFAQTHQNWELILLDDGSTDRSLEIAKSIDDPRVRVFSDGENRRLGARLNQLAELASYEYIARMDADDLVAPTRIEKQLRMLMNHPELDLISTGICSLNDAGLPVSSRCVHKMYSISSRKLLVGRGGIVHASVVAKTAWFRRNKYRENLRCSEDANLWIRAFAKKDLNVGYITEPLYYYREDGNVTGQKLTTAYSEGIRTIIKDSGRSYSLLDKAYGIAILLSKLIAMKSLLYAGQLEVLRSRRNGSILSTDYRRQVGAEISYIKNIQLPIKNSY